MATPVDKAALTDARAMVNNAKIALGERGAVWWADGSPDFTRRIAERTPYAAWYRSLQGAGGGADSDA